MFGGCVKLIPHKLLVTAIFVTPNSNWLKVPESEEYPISIFGVGLLGHQPYSIMNLMTGC